MRKQKTILLLIFIAVVVLGLTTYVVVSNNTLDDRAEATDINENVFESIAFDCAQGDINCDNEIDMIDFNLFRQDLNSYESTGWSESFARSDLNDDSKIDEKDYEIFIQIFQENF